MASVRAVRNRRTGELVSHRIEVKRTYDEIDPETGEKKQIHWSRNRRIDPRMTAHQNEVEAQAVGIRAEHDLDASVHPQARYDVRPELAAVGMTVGQWVRETGERKKFASKRTRATWWSFMNVHVLPTWDTVPMDAEHVTHERLQGWVDGLNLAPRSIHTISGALKTMILDGVVSPRVPLSHNPYVRLRLPKPEPTGRRALTAAEVGAICEDPPLKSGVKRPTWWKIFKQTMIFTGFRLDELCSRDVEHFDLIGGIEIPQTSARHRGQPAAVESREPRRRSAGKTPAAVRRAALCGSHRAELVAYLGGRTSGPLFLNSHGRRPSTSSAYSMWVLSADAAGLPLCSPHWGRYTAKTTLADAGVHDRAIDYHLGHEPERMGRYITPTPRMMAAIPAAFQDLWDEVWPAGTSAKRAAR